MNRGRRIPQPLPKTLDLKKGAKVLSYTFHSSAGNVAQYLDEEGEFHFFNIVRLRERINLPEFVWEGENQS